MTSKDQHFFEQMLPPGASHLTPKELASASGYSTRFILDSYDSGKIMGFSANGTAKKESGQRTIRIPRIAALIWLSGISNFDALMVSEAIESIIDKSFTMEMKRELAKRLSK